MLKLKVCGMKYPKNILALAALNPDYIGFIFYPKSKRYMAASLNASFIKQIPESIKKVGVFVNDSVESIEFEVNRNNLDLVQLHGNESPGLCKLLKQKGIQIVKAFQIYPGFNFNTLDPFNQYCDYFLFDTQTPLYGGSGHKFDWELLNNYSNDKAFFLSGGIDLEDVDKIRSIKNLYIHAIDINSKFELSEGLKDIEKVKEFQVLLNLTESE
jgi:phosphoribosylanthranilate isomerase